VDAVVNENDALKIHTFPMLMYPPLNVFDVDADPEHFGA